MKSKVTNATLSVSQFGGEWSHSLRLKIDALTIDAIIIEKSSMREIRSDKLDVGLIEEIINIPGMALIYKDYDSLLIKQLCEAMIDVLESDGNVKVEIWK